MSVEEIVALALTAEYIGSPYHKDSPNFTGSFRPRPGAISAEAARDGLVEEPDCTICPRKWARRQDAATKLLRVAIRAGQISHDGGPNQLPRRVWARDPDDDGLVYEAQLIRGGYKAFPLTRAQALRLPVRMA